MSCTFCAIRRERERVNSGRIDRVHIRREGGLTKNSRTNQFGEFPPPPLIKVPPHRTDAQIRIRHQTTHVHALALPRRLDLVRRACPRGRTRGESGHFGAQGLRVRDGEDHAGRA